MISYSKEHNFPKAAAIANNNIGIATSIMGDDNKALNFFLESLRINKEIKDSQGIASSLNSIGLLYQNVGDGENAMEYFEQSIQLRIALGFKDGSAATLLNMGNHYAGRDPDKATEYYTRSLKVAREEGDRRGAASALGNLGNLHLDPSTADRALDYYLQSNELYKELNDEQGIINNIHNIGLLHNRLGKHREALKYCHEALERAIAIDILWEQKLSCTCLYNAYKALGSSDLALSYLEKIRVIDDSLAANKAAQSLREMELVKARIADSLNQVALDKQVEMEHRAALRKKSQQRNIVILAATLLLLLMWGLYGRWKKAIAERNLTEEKIDRVLQFEQLRKLDTIMEGQDMERKRIFEDLHDKLGGKFSALNYTWSSVFADELEAGGDKNKELKALNDIIQSLSSEISGIIKNNTRSSTEEFGLVNSLEELKFLVQSSHKMEINTLVHGVGALDRTVSLELYKIILELVGNALKYSKATHINVHLNQVDQHITLIVEDDGVGFDVNNINEGMGLKNIHARAERLGGVVEIDSRLGKGTTVIIELDA